MELNRNPSQTNRTATTVKRSSQLKASKSLRLARFSHVLTTAWVVLASMATAANFGLVQIIKSEMQNL